MEKVVIDTLARCLESNEPAALVSIISNTGSTPGKTGAMMLVRQVGETCGTVGGGNLEYLAIREANACLAAGISKEISYHLTEDSELKMSCGGKVKMFVKIFSSQPELLIVGAGHVGKELYALAMHQGFRTVIIDDRSEFNTEKNFPQAKRIVCTDVALALKEYPLSQNSYITIATPSHEADRMALLAVFDSDAIYKGMIGSSRKVKETLNALRENGATEEQVNEIYAPMGLDIASARPNEIALSIMSEILMVKNNGSLNHMRTIKKL